MVVVIMKMMVMVVVKIVVMMVMVMMVMQAMMDDGDAGNATNTNNKNKSWSVKTAMTTAFTCTPLSNLMSGWSSFVEMSPDSDANVADALTFSLSVTTLPCNQSCSKASSSALNNLSVHSDNNSMCLSCHPKN